MWRCLVEHPALLSPIYILYQAHAIYTIVWFPLLCKNKIGRSFRNLTLGLLVIAGQGGQHFDYGAIL